MFIIVDFMLVIGVFMFLVIEFLLEYGQFVVIYVVIVVVVIVGVEYLQWVMLEVYFWVGVVDEELIVKFYIVFGLGDVGDFSYGEKVQEQWFFLFIFLVMKYLIGIQDFWEFWEGGYVYVDKIKIFFNIL